VATTAASSAACVALAARFPALLATVGIQPNHVAEAAPGAWDEVVRLVTGARVVAVGETGLDRHWDFTPFALQEDYFARHLDLGRRTGKPVVIHCREAEADVLRMLRDEFERRAAADLERDLSNLGDPEARALVQKMLDMKQQHVKALEALADSHREPALR